MSISDKSLAAIRQDIKSALTDKLEAATATGEPLEGVGSVHYGEQANLHAVRFPIVWIIPAAHRPELKGGHTAMHDFTFDFVALTSSQDAAAGREEAEGLQARVYDLITADRKLGGVVQDVRPLNYDPSHTATRARHVHYAGCRFAFRITRRE